MIKKISLFKQREDFFFAFFLLLFLSFYSLLIEYNNYKNLTKFDSQLVQATLLKAYTKTKLTKTGKTKSYRVLKLKSSQSATFYTISYNTALHVGDKIKLEIWAGKISFYEYMKSFFAFSKLLKVYPRNSLKQTLNLAIAEQHANQDIADIYQALYSAQQLKFKLQKQFSSLGISHLIAISGFHLGVLSALLFFLFKYPYNYFQNRYFPYRSYKVDSFSVISLLLLSYLLFLDSPASLLRAFGMLLIGFILYDRGIKIISMQTLFISTILLLALFPRLAFSIGFGLSVAGVFQIFLFLIYFKNLSKIWQFFLLPFWVYLLMLPYSLIIFANFSLYHPLSILWSILFTLFYPLSIFAHLVGQGQILDSLLLHLINLNTESITIVISKIWLIPYVLLSVGAIFRRSLFFALFLFALAIFVYAIYNVTQF